MLEMMKPTIVNAPIDNANLPVLNFICEFYSGLKVLKTSTIGMQWRASTVAVQK